MTETLIKPDQIWLIWSIILVIVVISMSLEKKYKWGQVLTGAVISLVFAILLTNFRILPMESTVYDTVWDYAIPLSIPMLLFRSNIRKIFSESGRMLLIFFIGSIGTVLGAFVAFGILKNHIEDLGKVAGMMTGSYIGGGVNFVALSQVFDLDKTMVSATTVADNFNMAIYFVILSALPNIGFFKKNFIQSQASTSHRDEYKKKTYISTFDLAAIFATSCAIVALSNLISGFFAEIIPRANAFSLLINQLLGNPYLIITTLTMVLTTAFPKYFENISGAEEVGSFLIYIFFVVIGVPASIPLIIKTAPLLLVFCFIMVLFNMLVVLLGAKLLKVSLQEAIIGSNANIGGPSTAAAMAISKGWYHLIGPGIFAGLFGYIIGNYLGTIVGNILI